jgi:anti-sigma factor RsiW
MRCITVRKQLNRYLDAELAPRAREEVECHLSACPACRAALAELQGVAGMWAALKTPPVPEGFAARVMQEARKRTPPKPQRAGSSWPLLRWWWEQSLAMRTGAAAMVVVGVFAGAFLGFSSSRPLAEAGGPARPANAVAENLTLLSGTPHGSLDQTYLALAFPSESPPHSP